MRVVHTIITVFSVVVSTANAFQSSCYFPAVQANAEKSDAQTQLYMAKANDKDSDFMRFAKQSRSASVGDTVVELNRPLGLVLNEDENGNVYVETVAPKGNAARTGKVSMFRPSVFIVSTSRYSFRHISF